MALEAAAQQDQGQHRQRGKRQHLQRQVGDDTEAREDADRHRADAEEDDEEAARRRQFGDHQRQAADKP